MGNAWLEQELGSEAMMALGDVIREGTPYTVMVGTPHFAGFQALLDWGYITCANDVGIIESGTRITSVTADGRCYYSELHLRKNALEREERSIGSAVSAAKFTAIAALAALISPAQDAVLRLLTSLQVQEPVPSTIAACVELLLVIVTGFLGFKFYKKDSILRD